MAYPGMHENEAKEKSESSSEEYAEGLGACDSADISEYCGTSTVKDFPTATDEKVHAANAAYNKTQTRGV